MLTTGVRWRTRFAGRCRRLVSGLIVVAVCSLAKADQLAVTSLLKSLDLVSYPAGTIPPQFGGQTPDGGKLSLAELRGMVVLVNFWASWCLECRPEMPVLERLHREFASRGLAVIGINVREGKEAVRRYAKNLGLTFRLVLDPDGKINAQYGVIGLPTTFVVGRNGHAVALAIGPREWDSAPARALLQALLSEPTPPPERR
ncbi:MAG TPA: TlpA disulfide reductase family protein [Candidatus Methylomirabilis sp.]|nr:TlpA disulfide reductase family protein [Candidatus Methylomirabilis sp.]